MLRVAAPLVLGSSADVHVRELVAYMSRKGVAPLVLDADQARLQNWQAGIEFGGNHGHCERGIIRGLPLPNVHSDGSAEATAWLDFVEGIAHDPAVEWLTPLAELRRADNKLYQLRLAELAGIRFPLTMITQRPDILEQTLGVPFVVKPLGSGVVPRPGGHEEVFYTTLVNQGFLRDEQLAAAPVIAQEYVRADEHLRVVTVCEQVWCASLPAHESYIDWREMPPLLRQRWHAIAVHPKLREDASSIAQIAQVRFSCQDWIKAGNDYWFLDLNPVGNWLFLPSLLASSVTKAIAQWLIPGS